MLRSLGRLFGTDRPTDPQALLLRLEALERAEVTRAAEHHDMLDRLERLYKRLTQRMIRAGIDTSPEPGKSIVGQSESVLELRRRLRP